MKTTQNAPQKRRQLLIRDTATATAHLSSKKPHHKAARRNEWDHNDEQKEYNNG